MIYEKETEKLKRLKYKVKVEIQTNNVIILFNIEF